MSKKEIIKPLSLTISTVFSAGMLSASPVHADINPFSATILSSGYMLAEKGAEGQCGAKKSTGEAECGANKAKSTQEAKCGEAKCGSDKAESEQEAKPVQEAKCGEAKCGGTK